MGVLHLYIFIVVLAISTAFEVSLHDILGGRLLKNGGYLDRQENERSDEDMVNRETKSNKIPMRDLEDFDVDRLNPSFDILGTQVEMARERRQPGGQSSVLPPWSEFCRMLNMRECSRYKRSILKKALLSSRIDSSR